MSYFSAAVDLDQAFNEIRTNTTINLSHNPVRLNLQGKIVYEEDDRIYKIYPADFGIKIIAFQNLMAALDLQFFKPLTIEYQGETIIILSQEITQEIQKISSLINFSARQWSIKEGAIKFLDRQLLTSNEEEINNLIFQHWTSDFAKIADVAAAFQIRDLYKKNLGLIDNKVYCIDFDPRQPYIPLFKQLFEKHKLPSETILNYLPLLR